MTPSIYAKVIWEDFVSLIFPRTCVHCDETLVRNEVFLCTKCRVDLPYTQYHLNAENPIKQKFMDNPLVHFASSFLHFHRFGVAQDILYELKYRGNYEIGIAIGQWYGETLKEFLPEYDHIIPVPIHRNKEKVRGYNQSMAIAEGLSAALSIPLWGDLVSRIRHTSTQTRKNRAERWLNVDGIFHVSPEADLHGKSLLIVDDVITTGATIGSLCEVLTSYEVISLGVLSIATGAK